jgi:protein-L-isoaspartate(D-aspartate) O-methyltransferase
MATETNKMNKTQLMEQLIKKGHIKNLAIEKAFMNVDRGDFIPDDQKGMTYYDIPLSIPAAQTISAPSMVAMVLELAELKKGIKVLEVGTGSGYNAALIAEIVGEENIISIERNPELIEFAKKNLEKSGHTINIINADGSRGYAKEAPYDRIISTAAAPEIPNSWKKQLKEYGILVAPIGGRHFYQELIVARKNSEGKINELKHGGCVFVPLIGEEAWPEYSER